MSRSEHPTSGEIPPPLELHPEPVVEYVPLRPEPVRLVTITAAEYNILHPDLQAAVQEFLAAMGISYMGCSEIQITLVPTAETIGQD